MAVVVFFCKQLDIAFFGTTHLLIFDSNTNYNDAGYVCKDSRKVRLKFAALYFQFFFQPGFDIIF